MDKEHSLPHKIQQHLYDHPILRESLRNTGAVFILIVSAFAFALGYKCFLVPNVLIEESNGAVIRLLSGGISGISQLVIMIVSMFPVEIAPQIQDTVFSILYFVLNIPIFILAWKGIGKRFTIFTILNVFLCSLLSNLLGIWDQGWINDIASFVNRNGGLLSRAIFAGVCTGLSSGLSFKVDGSSGGIDVISYYIALKKGVLVGKYTVLINAVTLTIYTILGTIQLVSGMITVPDGNSMEFVTMALYSILYLMVTSGVVDAINLRNKKVKIEVVTNSPDLAKIIISALPHGATVFHGQGAFTGKEKTIIEIVVSSYEVKNAVKIIREADPSAFIEITELKQIYGRFFLPPVK